MFSVSAATRRVAADLLSARVTAAISSAPAAAAASAASVANFSTLLSNNTRGKINVASMPSVFALTLPVTRGLATRSSPAPKKKAAAAGGAKAKSSATTAAAKKGRGARSANKKPVSDAAKKAKLVGSLRRIAREAEQKLKNKQSVIARRAKRAAAETARREAHRQSLADRRAKKLARERSLAEQRAARRKITIAKNQARRAKQNQIQVERRARLRDAARRRVKTARLIEHAKAVVSRAKSFRARHPSIARRLKMEQTTGLSAPRRPTPLVARYVKANFQRVRDQLLAKSNGAKVATTEVLKAVSAEFKSIDADSRQKLEAEFQQALAVYLKEKAKFDAAGPPKKPVTAYISYFSRTHGDVARANPSASMPEITKLVSEKWRALPESEKKSFVAASERAMSEWKENVLQWAEAHPNANLTPRNIKTVANDLKIKEEQKQAKAAKATKKAPTTIKKGAAKKGAEKK